MKPLKEEDILAAYKNAIEVFRDDLDEVIDVIKETVNEEIVSEENENIESVQEELTKIRQEIIELFK